jgi:ribose transport system ATP-binding protein
LGNEIKNAIGWIDNKKMRALAVETFRELGVTLDLDEEVKNLSVGQQQMIEIAKSLLSDGEVIIMDEPTAALTEREIEVLFRIIQNLKQKNVAIIYISHRMEEIFKISDRITVMRDGVSVDTKRTADTNNDEVVRKMVGRDLADYYPAKTSKIGPIVFEAKKLSSERKFQDVSFQLKAGEIVGFSGLMGARRTEIMRSIFGIDPLDSGEMYLEDKKITISNPNDAIRQGIGFLTENRKEEGLILDYSISENISLPSIDGFRKNGLIDTQAEKDFVELLMERLQVKAEGRRYRVRIIRREPTESRRPMDGIGSKV